MADRGHFCTCLLRLYHHLFRNGGGVSRKAPGNKAGYLKNGYGFGRDGSGKIRGNSESGGTARGVNCLMLTKKRLNFWIIREVKSQKKESKNQGPFLFFSPGAPAEACGDILPEAQRL
jgi:hypothetical protein